MDSAIDSVVAVWYLALDFGAVIFGCLSSPKAGTNKAYHSLSFSHLFSLSALTSLFLFFVFVLCIFA